MQLLRYFWDAACELDPAAEAQDEGRRASICHPDALLALMTGELSAVEVAALVVPTRSRRSTRTGIPFSGV